ncbi:MAG: hypothetical protein AAF682_14265 [Planctomycetota bacterium]
MNEQRRPRPLRRVLAACASLFAAFLVVELAARAFTDPPSYLNNMPLDPDLGYGPPTDRSLMRRDTRGEYEYRTSSLGFRGPELPGPGRPSPAGTRRLMFLGDSFLEGWGVREESLMPFSSMRLLRERGIEVESYNVSAKGIGTGQELLLFRRHQADIEPDVVVVSLYPGNDVVDNTPELIGYTQISAGSYVRPFLVDDGGGGLRTTWRHPLRAALRARSHAFAVAEHALVARGVKRGPEADAAAFEERLARLASGRLPRASLELFLPPEPGGVWEAGWRRTEDLLRGFRREVEAAGAHLVVVVIPHKYQVQIDALLAEIDNELHEADQAPVATQLDWNLPERRLVAFAEREGITLVPLLSALRERTTGEAYSQYLRDGHMSWRGHEVAGELVADAAWELLAGRTPPAPPAPAGVPVDLVELQCRTRSWFDFADDLYPELLGGGWDHWAGRWGQGLAGWIMLRSGRVSVPHRGGELVVQGWLPAHAKLPQGVRVHVGGVDLGPLARIDSTGPFELRFPVPPPPGGDGPPVVLGLTASGAFASPAKSAPRYGLVLTAIGYR